MKTMATSSVSCKKNIANTNSSVRITKQNRYDVATSHNVKSTLKQRSVHQR